MDDRGSMGSGVKLRFDDFELEFPHVFWEIVVAADSSIGEPSGSFGGGVCALEGNFEICDKILESSEGGGVQGHLSTDSSPTFGCSFGHEGEGVSDLFVVGGVDVFVYEEISPDRVQPVLSGGRRSVICFGHVETEFSGFDRGHGWGGWWWVDW